MTSPAHLLLVAASALQVDSTSRAPLARPPLAGPVARAASARLAPDDTTPRRARPRAVEVSDAYARRLTLHRRGAYAMLPLFAAQYALGARMHAQGRDLDAGRRAEPIDGGLRAAHGAVALGIGGVFALNTVTGVKNAREARGAGQLTRVQTVHAVTMLASEAGMVTSAVMGLGGRSHRPVALTSIGLAAAGVAMMLVLDRD